MMEFFYEKVPRHQFSAHKSLKKDFFQLKELERLCQKEKGINSMSVKDVLMSLVHDGMVDTDKIGTCVYFWAFPNKATQKHKNTIERLKVSIESTKQQADKVQNALQQAGASREDTSERRQILDKLTIQRARLEELTSELAQLRKCDPERLEELKSERQCAFDAANRWTDNVFVIQSWLRNKFSLEEAQFRRQFNIPENFDYIE
ncbi:Mnd1 family protein [Opisthorchis viverrini]|uniref:Meiotic nuclear division protein 1 homolog n=1 Tax=Opisthorchis viverrini TaxID=6198 RepID=A0A1S8XAG6_OPIVI|nr:Mnd1 family protein [Opisthorchis viverrini]